MTKRTEALQNLDNAINMFTSKLEFLEKNTEKLIDSGNSDYVIEGWKIDLKFSISIINLLKELL